MEPEITENDFEEQVIQLSYKTPVLVDFWAEWCGPCKALGPVLEKVEQDLAGKFKLVKINTETSPQIAQAYSIQSIPACKLFIDGKVAAEFVGALPETQIKAFFDDHLPSEELDQLLSLLQSGQLTEAEQLAMSMKESKQLDEHLFQLLREYARKEQLTTEKTEVLLKKVMAVGSQISDRRNAILKTLEDNDETANETVLKMLNPDTAEAHLNQLLENLADSGVNDSLKNQILTALNIEADNPNINEFRKRYSRLLY